MRPILFFVVISLLASCKKDEVKRQPVLPTYPDTPLVRTRESIIGVYNGTAGRRVQYGWQQDTRSYNVVKDTSYPATLEIVANGPNEFMVKHRGHNTIYTYDVAKEQYSTGDPAKGGELLKLTVYGKIVEYRSDDTKPSYNEGEYYSFTGTKE